MIKYIFHWDKVRTEIFHSSQVNRGGFHLTINDSVTEYLAVEEAVLAELHVVEKAVLAELHAVEEAVLAELHAVEEAVLAGVHSRYHL